ncbi:MAG: hypothetical protein N4A47_00220 [Clostridia bacterium]|nr:hypothetical protein [Clostridia bacterium]
MMKKMLLIISLMFFMTFNWTFAYEAVGTMTGEKADEYKTYGDETDGEIINYEFDFYIGDDKYRALAKFDMGKLIGENKNVVELKNLGEPDKKFDECIATANVTVNGLKITVVNKNYGVKFYDAYVTARSVILSEKRRVLKVYYYKAKTLGDSFEVNLDNGELIDAPSSLNGVKADIEKDNGEIIIKINDDYVYRTSVSSFYKKMKNGTSGVVYKVVDFDKTPDAYDKIKHESRYAIIAKYKGEGYLKDTLYSEYIINISDGLNKKNNEYMWEFVRVYDAEGNRIEVNPAINIDYLYDGKVKIALGGNNVMVGSDHMKLSQVEFILDPIEQTNKFFIDGYGQDRASAATTIKTKKLPVRFTIVASDVGNGVIDFVADNERITLEPESLGKSSNMYKIRVLFSDYEGTYDTSANNTSKIEMSTVSNSTYDLVVLWFNKNDLVDIIEGNTISAVLGDGPNEKALNVFLGTIMEIIRNLGAFITFAAIMAVGIQMIVTKAAPVERAQAMYSLVYIAIGGFILGNLLFISSFVINTANNMFETFEEKYEMEEYVVEETNSVKLDGEVKEDVGGIAGLAIKGMVGVMDSIIDLGRSIKDMIFGEKSDINTVLFLNDVEGDANLSALEPFSPKEWNVLLKIYATIASIAIPLVFLMVAKTGFEYIIFSQSVDKRSVLKGDFFKWIMSVFIMPIFPWIFKMLIIVFNELVLVLPVSSMNIDYMDIINTNNPLGDAIFRLFFVGIELNIYFIFLVRKIMLTILFVISPLAIFMWGMRAPGNTIKIWFGEIFSNLSTQFFYALTFYVMAYLLVSTDQSWLYFLVWMMMAMQVAKMLKNSLQTFFASKMGIDEEKVASGVMGQVGNTLGVVKNVTGVTAKAAGAGLKMFKQAGVNKPTEFKKGSGYQPDPTGDAGNDGNSGGGNPFGGGNGSGLDSQDMDRFADAVSNAVMSKMAQADINKKAADDIKKLEEDNLANKNAIKDSIKEAMIGTASWGTMGFEGAGVTKQLQGIASDIAGTVDKAIDAGVTHHTGDAKSWSKAKGKMPWNMNGVASEKDIRGVLVDSIQKSIDEGLKPEQVSKFATTLANSKSFGGGKYVKEVMVSDNSVILTKGKDSKYTDPSSEGQYIGGRGEFKKSNNYGYKS